LSKGELVIGYLMIPYNLVRKPQECVATNRLIVIICSHEEKRQQLTKGCFQTSFEQMDVGSSCEPGAIQSRFRDFPENVPHLTFLPLLRSASILHVTGLSPTDHTDYPRTWVRALKSSLSQQQLRTNRAASGLKQQWQHFPVISVRLSPAASFGYPASMKILLNSINN
jgi:hypothetical protein